MLEKITEVTAFLRVMPLTIFVVFVGIYICICCNFLIY